MQIRKLICLGLGLYLIHGLCSMGSATPLEESLDVNKGNTLINAAERASMMADITRGLQYPKEKLQDAKNLFFQDSSLHESAGDIRLKTTDSLLNNKIIAGQYANTVLENAIGAISRGMDTKTNGIPVMVYNPLSLEREDVVSIHLKFQNAPPPFIHVYNADKYEVRSQVIARHANSLDVIFLAKMSYSGVEVFNIIPSLDSSRMPMRLKVTPLSLENYKYRIELNKNGDISRIYDKAAKQEMLSKPIQLELYNDKPGTFMAPGNPFTGGKSTPRNIVKVKPEIKVIEQGPVRGTIQVRRVYAGSEYIQKIQLSAGGAGDHLVIDQQINWKTKGSVLKTVFPLTVSNTTAVYDSGFAVIQPVSPEPASGENPVKQWANIDRVDKSYGIAILQDSIYGWEKPNKNTLRLDISFPAGSTGISQHHFQTAIYGHASTWKEGEVFWQSARLNTPMMAFISLLHNGDFGKHYAPVIFENRQVALNQMKKADDGEEYVFRFQEMTGEPAKNLALRFGLQVLSAREVDGNERAIGPVKVKDQEISFDMFPFQSRMFAIRLADSLLINAPPKVHPLSLPYNQDGISPFENMRNGDFDGRGISLASESLPSVMTTEDICFQLGPRERNQLNVLSCEGQTLGFEPGKYKQVYLLAASADKDITAEFRVGDTGFPLSVQYYSGFFGIAEQQGFTSINTTAGKQSASFRKPAIIAWMRDYVHTADEGLIHNKPVYLFKYKLPVPKYAETLRLPNEPSIKILAITLADNPNDSVLPAGLVD